jgi:guanylate kinase
VSPRRGIPFVVSAPSGTGKTTVCRTVVKRDPEIDFSVSHTTRAPRLEERDGADYFFVSRECFRAMIAEGAFIEHAEYAGNLYGTSLQALDEPLGRGRDLILEVEVQGARQIRARRKDARFVFLLPPSLEELERRLRRRATDPPEAVSRRLAIVHEELAAVHDFDYAVVNDELEATIGAVLAIVRAERTGDTAAVRARYGRQGVVRERGPALGLRV